MGVDQWGRGEDKKCPRLCPQTAFAGKVSTLLVVKPLDLFDVFVVSAAGIRTRDPLIKSQHFCPDTGRHVRKLLFAQLTKLIDITGFVLLCLVRRGKP